MADNPGTSTGKGFGKIIQKSVTRTKEKVLQNLGKADRTRDDDFEQHVQNFCDQQAVVERLQKELKHYTACVKEMSVASYSMYRTIKETYEINWTGYTQVASSVEQMSNIWEDYMGKLTDQVLNPVNAYINTFQDVKKLIAKRGRKLTDYDSARHNHESLCTAKRHDETKITKALDELNEARQVYETLNVKLNEDLPSFYSGRIGFLASLFNAMFMAESIFEHETAKLKDVMAEVSQKLSVESNREYPELRLKSFGVPLTRSDSDIENQRLENVRHGNIKEKNFASTSAAQDAKPSPAPRIISTYSNDLTRNPVSPSTSSDGFQQLSKQNNTRWFNSRDSDQKISDDEKEVGGAVAFRDASGSASSANGHYSLSKPLDDIYKCPTSNQPVSSLYANSDRVLYKVMATHAYVGDDTDELSFEPGDFIAVVPPDDPEEQDEGWLMGIKESSKEKGVFPENFTKRIE